MQFRGDRDGKVFPARAGMSLPGGAVLSVIDSFPRTRGDEPLPPEYFSENVPFSPHARG